MKIFHFIITNIVAYIRISTHHIIVIAFIAYSIVTTKGRRVPVGPTKSKKMRQGQKRKLKISKIFEELTPKRFIDVSLFC